MVCAARGYKLILTLPEGMSRERSALLRTYGAEVHETPSMGGMDEAVELAREARRAARRLTCRMQFSNPANAEIHRRTTAEEIWGDLDGEVDAFVAGVGTGGTITGVGQVLKERRPEARVIAVEPAASPVLSGGTPGPAQDPGDRRGLRARGPRPLGDRRGDRGRATRTRSRPRRPMAQREGILAGISAGAAVHAALEVAGREEMAGKRVVVIVPDSGERYMSLPFFAPEPKLLSHARPRNPRGGWPSEMRSDVAVRARPRPGGARASAPLEILTGWAGVQALLAHRVAHALWDSSVPLAPRRSPTPAARSPGSRSTPRPGSAPTSSSTTARAS